MNAERPHERKVCGAKNRQGTPCQRSPGPNGRCNLHGGKALRGMDAPGAKHLRYSQYLPKSIAERAEAFLTTRQALEQHEQIALLQTMLVEVLPDAFGDDAGGGKAWEALAAKVAEGRRAAAQRNSDLFQAIVQEIFKLVEDGRARYAARLEAREIVQDIRRLTESERKHRVEARTMVTADELLMFASAMGDALHRHVKDDRERANVVNDLTGFMRGFRAKTDAAAQ